MRKNILLPIAAGFVLIMGFNSCSKVANQLAQALGWTGVDVTIVVPPVSDTAMHTGMGSGTFTYNLDSFIKAKTANVLSLKNVDTFRFSSCQLTITNGANSTNSFGNFQTALASFSTSVNSTTTNLGEVDNNPATNTTTLSVPINNTANLKSYIPSSGPVTINYSYGGKLRTPITDTLTINAHVEYYIHVTP